MKKTLVTLAALSAFALSACEVQGPSIEAPNPDVPSSGEWDCDKVKDKKTGKTKTKCGFELE